MRNKFQAVREMRFKLLLTAVAFFAGAGACTKAKVELTSLGASSLSSKSAAMTLTSSPFSRETLVMDYVLFTGICPKGTDHFSWSKNGSTWYELSANTAPSPDGAASPPEVAGENSATYNGNCTGGVYKVWVYKHELVNGAFISANEEVSTMYLRAVDANSTELAQVSTSSTDGAGSPATISIGKFSPESYIADSGCQAITLKLLDSSNRSTSSTAAFTFGIEITNVGPITIYTGSACNTAPLTAVSLAFPAATSSVTYYYFASGLTAGNPLAFTTTNSANLSNTTLNMTVKNTTDVMVTAQLPFRMANDNCYEIPLANYSLSGNAYSLSGTYDINSAGVESYANIANCQAQTSAITSVSFSNASSGSIYLRKIANFTGTLSFYLSYNVGSPQALTDPIHTIENDTLMMTTPVDLHDPARLSLSINRGTMSVGVCYMIDVTYLNRGNTPVNIPLTGNMYAISSSIAGVTTTLFNSAAACGVGSPPASYITMPADSYHTSAYVKFSGAIGSNVSGTITVSKFTGPTTLASQTVDVVVGP